MPSGATDQRPERGGRWALYGSAAGGCSGCVHLARVVDVPATGRRRAVSRRASTVDRWGAGLAEVMDLAGRAPSPMGSRPWRLRTRSGGLELLVDTAKVPRRGTEGRRQALVACGAALLNLRLAVAHVGYEPRTTLFPSDAEPDVLARIMPAGDAVRGEDHEALMRAVLHRQTRREPFGRTYLPPDLRVHLAATAAVEGASLYAVPSGRKRDALDRIMAAAVLAHPHDPARIRGLRAEWNARAPATVEVLCTRLDGELDWLAAGQALQRLLLVATQEWVQARFFTLALESADLREQVRHKVTDQAYPHVILELGHAPGPEH